MPDATDPSTQFSKAEPVVTAGAATSLSIGLTTAVIELAEAFGWQTFTAVQVKALYGIVGSASALIGALIARRWVTPEAKVAARVAAAAAAIPPDLVAVPTRDGGTLLIGAAGAHKLPANFTPFLTPFPTPVASSPSKGDRLVTAAAAAAASGEAAAVGAPGPLLAPDVDAPAPLVADFACGDGQVNLDDIRP